MTEPTAEPAPPEPPLEPAGLPWPPLESAGTERARIALAEGEEPAAAVVTGWRTLRVAVDLPRGEGAPPADLTGLIRALQALAGDPTIGGDATVSRISGQVDHFVLDLSKPELP
jgi:hypothetical protein